MLMFGLVMFMLLWQFGLPRLVVIYGGSAATAEALPLVLSPARSAQDEPTQTTTQGRS